ncbi:GRAM domain-containing protein [Histoplasma capsulatum]|uniref:GRAM domain-containing protein n=2 Tax=Histoplasma TaxID=5036 RepID=A0A8A1MME0_AJECA|nr:GRAM domain-containing protein [Histoplasma capsulatum]
MDGTTSETTSSPSANGLKRVFTRPNRSKTSLSEVDGSTSVRSPAPSVESNHEPPRPSTSGAGGGEGNNYDGPPTGISKLISGARRRRKKKTMGMENPILQGGGDGTELQRIPNEDGASLSMSRNHSSSTVDSTDHGASNGSDPGRRTSPDLGLHLDSRQTASSPLIITTNAPPDPAEATSDSNATSDTAADISRHLAHAATTGDMGVYSRSSSADRKNQNLKNQFSPNTAKKSRSPSPDLDKSPLTKSGKSLFKTRSRRSSTSAKNSPKPSEEVPPVPLSTPRHVATSNISSTFTSKSPHVTSVPPSPSSAAVPDLVTTVTPPTPAGHRSQSPALPSTNFVEDSDSAINFPNLPPNAVVSSSGNMISHRRVRSASAAHSPSKLSNSMTAPLTPTVEDSKTAQGFFSSMLSAAQNAASNFGNSLNSQARAQPAPQPVELDNPNISGPNTEAAADPPQDDDTSEKKELAVETLGMGELNFSHLGIDASAGGEITTKDGVVFTKTETTSRPRRATASQRDEISARIEDMRAAHAVSMAYEKPADGPSTSQPAPELLRTGTPSSTPFNGLAKGSTGEQTPPSGSIFEGETGAGVQRSGSVRSRLARRHRGSSSATIGPLGAAGLGLGIPGANTSAPRLTGFAVASKKRNRDFHQLFRSVPEDDYLIEDYSCALQREIILAGRIYISEGHICFSSNILGWVTTLVISFDEIIAIEKESTAVVFPNAIAIQTLHARHTFRSLLSREATYDLMVNIWKVNHPTLESSLNGTRIEQGSGDKTEKADESDAASEGPSDEEDEIYDEDEEDEGTNFLDAVDAGIASSDKSEPQKGISRKGSNIPLAGSYSIPQAPSKSEAKAPEKGAAASTSSLPPFPGPATHAPTEFTDPSGRYDKVIKDEIILAPLGFVYTLVFGPASGSFVPKFLLDYQKVTDLQFEDDQKGLSMDNKTRSYSYTKPLNAPIGPKQTKCTSHENLDFLDLEKAVLVTLTTQTPDVPSGNIFCVKTKYLFTWAVNNATRFYMTCTIEWSGKSWLKGPIEKGANDGQTTYGNDLVKALRAGVAPPSRSPTLPKSAGKGARGKRKQANTGRFENGAGAKAASESGRQQAENWGMLEPLRGPLGPIVHIFQPFWSGNVAAGVIAMVLVMIWFRSPPPSRLGPSGVGSPLLSIPERIVAYEELWQREESELWNWLEERVGMDGLAYPIINSVPSSDESEKVGHSRTERQRRRMQPMSEKELKTRLRNEKMTEREIEDAIIITQQRLDMLKAVMKRKRDDE